MCFKFFIGDIYFTYIQQRFLIYKFSGTDFFGIIVCKTPKIKLAKCFKVYFSKATYVLISLSSGLLGTDYTCFSSYNYFQCSLLECLVWIISYIIICIYDKLDFPKYKLVKSLEPQLTSNRTFKLVKLQKIGNYVCSRKVVFFDIFNYLSSMIFQWQFGRQIWFCIYGPTF